MTINEQELNEAVHEFFNEEDFSVGLYAVGKIDSYVIEEFKEAFEGVEIASYSDQELIFKLDNSSYKVELKNHYDNSEWIIYRLIIL